MSAEIIPSYRWDLSNWTRPQRASSLEVVSCATQLAVIGVREMGLVPLVPPKTVRICKAVRNYDATGETKDACQVDVNLPILDIKHNKIRRRASQLPGVIFHEFLHALRFERFPIFTLGSMAADEGIAYVFDEDFQRKLLFEGEYMPLDGEIPEDEVLFDYARFFKKKLDDSGVAEVDTDFVAFEYFESWNKPIRGYELCPLDFIGIGAVKLAVRQGAHATDLVDLPPAEILSFLDN